MQNDEARIFFRSYTTKPLQVTLGGPLAHRSLAGFALVLSTLARGIG